MSWPKWLTRPAATPVAAPAMVTVRVYGDHDTIVIEGAITHRWEAAAEGDLLAFSDGTVLKIEYGSAWQITVLHDGASTVLVKWCDGDGDTDVATLSGPIEWVVLGSEIATVTR